MRRVGWAVSGSIWAGLAAATIGSVLAAPALFVFWKPLTLGGLGVAVLGQRAGRFAFRRQLSKLTRGEVPLNELRAHGEGELACVRGRIEATSTLTGLLHGTPGVYRRLVFDADGVWIHEAAVDFSLVDRDGNRILVQAAGARWLAEPRERMEYPVARLFAAGVPHEVQDRARRSTYPTKIDASERVLEVGAEVQIVGYKTASADVTGDVSDYRSPPTRATLRSGDDLPLVITLVEDL